MISKKTARLDALLEAQQRIRERCAETAERNFKARLMRYLKKLRGENETDPKGGDYDRITAAQGYEAALDNMLEFLEKK